MTVRALIVEDEPLARQTLQTYIDEIPGLICVGEAEDGLSAVESIETLKPDLIFLDVRIPEISGLEVLRRIRHQPAVVFTTAHDQYAVDAFEIGAVDYLMKPFGVKRFQETVKRVADRLQHGTKEPAVQERISALSDDEPVLNRIFIRDGLRIIPVRTEHIIRFEACDDYVSVHTSERTHLLLITLSELEKRLAPDRFIRIHRSHLINLDQIDVMQPYDDRRLMVTLLDGTEIIASRSGSQTLRRLMI